jgi:hypothetical protein
MVTDAKALHNRFREEKICSCVRENSAKDYFAYTMAVCTKS